MSPIAQAIAPVFTLIGTLVEGVLKLSGVLLNTVGVVLKLAGAFTRTLLSPVIVGFTNAADGIRYGMGKAFDFIGSRIDFVSQKLKDFYAFMATVPVIGRAFASGATPAAPGAAAGAGAEQAAADGMRRDQLDFELQLYTTRLQNEQAIADARKKASSDQLDADLANFADRRKMEQDIENANKKADAKAASDKLDEDLRQFAIRRENEQAIGEANRKRQEEVAAKQGEVDKFTAERQAALGGKSNEALKANDLRSGEGMAQFLALASGREDPAIAEYRKQTQKLDEIRGELRALQQDKVDILGAAA
jgi:hypothetical protein